MKRLRKVTQWVLVWVSVGLLSVDPASACRLLANRRCCCCCPCQPIDCPPVDCGGEQNGPGQESSPSDVPPGARTDAGQLPTLPLAAPSPAVGPTRPIATEAAGARSAAANIVDVRPISPAAINPATPAITEPSTAPAVTGQTVTRQPVGIVPPAAADVAPPAADISATPRTEAPSLAPQPATLMPRQTFDSATTPMPKAGEPSVRQPAVPEVGSIVRPDNRSQGTGDRRQGTGGAGPRALAAPASIAPASPVVPPAFPPVSDDPFAPLGPNAIAPRATEPQEDDPFAPLKPNPATDAKPAAPIVAEPTMKMNDMLLPGPDGRLPLRQWSDNSGQFRVQARLVLILDGKVQLLKETGRTTTVPVERLSPDDRAYVDAVINRYGKDLASLLLVSR